VLDNKGRGNNRYRYSERPLFTISFSLIKIFTNHHRHLPEPVGIGVSDVDNDLLESIVRFLRLLDCPRDLPVFGPMAEREVLWRLINGAQGAVVRQIGLAEGRLS
jgi:hypothetical protein